MHKQKITKTHSQRQIKVLSGHISYCGSRPDDSQKEKWKYKNIHHWCSAGARQSAPASRTSLGIWIQSWLFNHGWLCYYMWPHTEIAFKWSHYTNWLLFLSAKNLAHMFFWASAFCCFLLFGMYWAWGSFRFRRFIKSICFIFKYQKALFCQATAG